MQRIVLFFLLGMFTSLPLGSLSYSYASPLQIPTNKNLHILSTIKPIHLLVKSIAGQRARTTLLIPENADNHHYSLRPSDMKKLKQADVVIRVSEHFEVMLNKLLLQKQQVISITNTPKLNWLSMRGFHGKAHEHGETHEEEGHTLEQDLHVWLDPDNVIKIVDYLSEMLGKVDPPYKDYYAQNGQRLIAKIQQTHLQTKEKLESVQDVPYLVFHDSWQYLEQAYGLREPQVISVHEGLPSGVKTLLDFRLQIKEKNIHCLIASPYSNKKIIRTLSQDLPIYTARISVNGMNLSDKSYPEFMRRTSDQIALCLKGDK